MSTSNYDKSAARRLMAEIPGTNYTTALRRVQEGHGQPASLLPAIANGPSHLTVIGPTGSGKTVLIENIMISHLRSGHEVFMIDPRGVYCLPSIEPYLSAPVVSSPGDAAALLERLADPRGYSPVLLVVDELAGLIDAEGGEKIGDLIARVLRTGVSRGVRVVLSLQSSTYLRGPLGMGVEDLSDKVLMGRSSGFELRWFNFSAIDREEELRHAPQGAGIYLPATVPGALRDSRSIVRFQTPLAPRGEELAKQMRLAGASPRTERDQRPSFLDGPAEDSCGALSIVGRPGAGKTSLIRSLVATHIAKGHDVYMFAPNGSGNTLDPFLAAPVARSPKEAIEIIDRATARLSALKEGSGLPMALIVMDDIAGYAADDEFQNKLAYLSRIARSLRIRLVVSSQSSSPLSATQFYAFDKVLMGRGSPDEDRWLGLPPGGAPLGDASRKGSGIYLSGSSGGTEHFVAEPMLTDEDVVKELRRQGIEPREQD